ncbi:MAG: tannase/feruloyl esterase family alpha/beta hydrolase [Gammaproteobacteria bacterium]|nr:tannase/feruloyl esterase family alpha/beta hydrolase [Gammaproteobacteria bacterium]
MSDPVFSANDLIDYYRRVIAANGGVAATRRFARLFLVPGMNHCGGGSALDQFDPLTALQSWVEQGRAPDWLSARGAAFPGRTGRLCAYPAVARYKGSGDVNSAGSFACR